MNEEQTKWMKERLNEWKWDYMNETETIWMKVRLHEWKRGRINVQWTMMNTVEQWWYISTSTTEYNEWMNEWTNTTEWMSECWILAFYMPELKNNVI